MGMALFGAVAVAGGLVVSPANADVLIADPDLQIITLPGDSWITVTPIQSGQPQVSQTPQTSRPSQTSQTPVSQTSQGPRPSGKVTIDVATVNGSGCPLGTAAIAVSSDNEAFTVTYSEYLVSTDAVTNKNCQLSMVVNVPSGYTYAVASADYRGYADLASGATGSLQSVYYFAGASSTAYTNHQLSGPRAGNWQFTDVVDYKTQVWHPCGAKRNLNVNTRLIVNGGSSWKTSYMNMDSTDVSFSTVYNFSWATC